LNLQLDHVLTFANVPNIDTYVEQYRALGFVVSDETRPYKPGLRNRFIQLGLEYLELVWVANEDAFARGDTDEFARMYPDLPTLRQAARPFSLGFITQDVAALHQQWTQRGYTIPPVWSFAPPGMPPILSFQDIPAAALPGASCFAITYHTTASGQARGVQRAPNTTYAVEGITFVSTAPQEAARCWQTLLNPEDTLTMEQDVYTVMAPPHRIWWMHPQRFQEGYGVAWTPPPHQHGHLAAIHVLAENLDVAAEMLGPRVQSHVQNPHQDELLIISPTSEDGVTFIIRQYPIEQWRRERSRTTSENIVLA
jgi:hypothetical protein